MTELVAPGVVNTMPEATLRLVADHGQVPADSVHGHYDQSNAVLGQLRELGIDYDDVVQALEDDGVAKFDASLGPARRAAGLGPANLTGQPVARRLR